MERCFALASNLSQERNVLSFPEKYSQQSTSDVALFLQLMSNNCGNYYIRNLYADLIKFKDNRKH